MTKSANGDAVSFGRGWIARLERVRKLQSWPLAAREVLRFYLLVLEFQRNVTATIPVVSQPIADLRAQLDISCSLEHLDCLLPLTIQHGPPSLASRARELQAFDRSQRTNLFKAFIAEPNDQENPNDFFLRAVLQPIAEQLQSQADRIEPKFGAVCPVCGGLPQLSVLRPEGDGGARWLQCSFCLREWLFRRVICPWCGEEDKEKLPRFSAQQCAHVHISACDTCKRYLKSVDMTMDGLAVPLVDEVAMTSLDVWAIEQGLKKIRLNLMGF